MLIRQIYVELLEQRAGLGLIKAAATISIDVIEHLLDLFILELILLVPSKEADTLQNWAVHGILDGLNQARRQHAEFVRFGGEGMARQGGGTKVKKAHSLFHQAGGKVLVLQELHHAVLLVIFLRFSFSDDLIERVDLREQERENGKSYYLSNQGEMNFFFSGRPAITVPDGCHCSQRPVHRISVESRARHAGPANRCNWNTLAIPYDLVVGIAGSSKIAFLEDILVVF